MTSSSSVIHWSLASWRILGSRKNANIRGPTDHDLARSSPGIRRTGPALLSLGLFLDGSIRPAILVVDAAVLLVALVDMATLIGSKKFHVERKVGLGLLSGRAVLRRADDRESRRPVRAAMLRLRDDVPETMVAEPADFVAKIPRRGASLSQLQGHSPEAGRLRVPERVDALISSRLGFWQRSVTLEGVDPASRSIRTFARSAAIPCSPAATS